MPPEPPSFAATRAAALESLARFVPRAGRYSRGRNKLVPGHTNVSLLSPAIRHGLIGIDECEAAVLRHFAPSTVEKFVQELHWRRYWKSWLSLRPQVWDDYRCSLQELRNLADWPALQERAGRLARGESSIAIMNHFARELTATGYLHNHARMWFAGWWIHVEHLPWQLGADFFFRHLLDADAASNTLSWRWVAGLQTRGKSYLPRRSNLEKNIDPDILAQHADGLALLEHVRPHQPELFAKPVITCPSLPDDPIDKEGRLGLWIHEEDLRPELGPLATLHPDAILVASHHGDEVCQSLPEHRRAWLDTALDDAAGRAEAQFAAPTRRSPHLPLARELSHWVTSNNLNQVVALRPDVGPIGDKLDELRAALTAAGAGLRLVSRPEDLATRTLATGGFFDFWKKIRRETAPE